MLVVITCSSALRLPGARSWSCRGVANDHPVPGDLPRPTSCPSSFLSARFRYRCLTNSRCLSRSPHEPTDEAFSYVPQCVSGPCQASGYTASPYVAGGGEGRSCGGWPTSRPFSAVESVSSPTRFRVGMTCSSMGFVPLRGLSDGGAVTGSELLFLRFRGVAWLRRASVLTDPLRCADLIGLIPGEFSRSSG